MTDEASKKMAPNYPGNTNKARVVKPEVGERVKQDKIIVGEVIERKKSLGRKMRDAMTGDDAQTVWSYLVIDVFVPAVKTLAGDLLTQGLNRAMWGSSSPSRISTQKSVGYHNMYRQMGSAQTAGRGDPRGISQRSRAVHDFTEIVLPDRAQADEVIERLSDIVSEYGFASVSDLYDLVGIQGSYTDDKWGWDDLRSSGVSNVREGWLLNLPRTKAMD